MTRDVQITVRVQKDNFDTAEELARLTTGRSDIGAVVSFSGLCRDEDGTLSALELEHYPGMAEAELERIAGSCADRWPIMGMTIIHRFGKLVPGENIVLVVATSSHRQAAFESASFVMDYLKTRAPFWKRQHSTDGTPGTWVESMSSDDRAARRWK